MKEKRKILVFNVGSSSIKYSLFEGSVFIESEDYEKLKTKKDYEEAVNKIFKKIDVTHIDLIIHRVVHGGSLQKPIRITKEVKNKIKRFSEFAPLHNPRQLMVIELCEKYKKPQYAVFDTIFFSALPEVAKSYAIPKEITKKYGIKRYGFHGLSHESVSKNLKGKTITCHLGSGVSISAILDGKPLDTTMGFTPLEGLIMGTRSGSIDPGIIFFLEKKGYNAREILTDKSGLKGICGYSDFRPVLLNQKNKDCRLAFDIFAYQIVKTIGSYIAVLGGLDNLVFTGRIGENAVRLREEVCKHLQFAGIKIDKAKNKSNSGIISSGNSRIKVLIRKSNEEEIAVEKVLKIL